MRLPSQVTPQHRISRRSLVGAAILLPLLACWPARGQSSAPDNAVQRVIEAARAQTRVTRFYDPAYVKLAYPGGDPEPDRGVCSDVVVRALRAGGVDLQRAVHEDMARNFSTYPHLWGLRAPDANIDHRRVANLMVFFKRRGKSLPITNRDRDYRPGDIVAWDLGSGLLHLGVVVDNPVNPSGDRALVHNIGAGARSEDVLFRWPIIGHYRYF